MESKSLDTQSILKLYELRRDEQMRKAREWYFTQFNPTSAADIVQLTLSGFEESAKFRMVTSYWDTAASLVNNGGIDEKLFLEANTEHFAIFAKLEPFIAEVREMFGEKTYLFHLEQLVMKIPHVKPIMASRRKLFAGWAKRDE